MKSLYPSFAPPEKWRNPRQTKKLKEEAWQQLRKKILERDNYTCAYCGYKSEKYQIVDHINGDPENNNDNNLQIVCQMCNLIKHSGQGCEIIGVVDLYGEARYNQNVIMKITRKMRDEGSPDNEIIRVLQLQNKRKFKMNDYYLKKLFGFVTSRKPNEENDMYSNWLKYHRRETKKKLAEIKPQFAQDRL